MESEQGLSAKNLQEKQIQNYWARDLGRRVYLLRRQRKAILENCRRIAVVGASKDPTSESFLSTEKLLGMSLEIIPVFPGAESFLALRCYPRLRDIPGKIDIVQVFSDGALDLVELAREAVDKQVATFWIENHLAASEEVEEILSNGKVQLVEYESLTVEYLKHAPFPVKASVSRRESRKAVKVSARMSKTPASVKPEDGIQEAISRMERGHFRHLPVIDDNGKLIGMLSDRDIRLIRPSLALVNKEDAMVQLWTLSVQQAAVFDPIKVTPETSLKETAELMLRWHVGGLPVVDHKDKLVGIITYTDLLREFIGNEE